MYKLINKLGVLFKICVTLVTFCLTFGYFSYSTLAVESSRITTNIYTKDKVIALTFDDGCDSISAGKILDTLQKYNVNGTFFLTGEFVKSSPEIVKRIAKDGHEILNHSYSHTNFTKIYESEMKSEIYKTYREIYNTTGIAPKLLFRPPGGNYNLSVLNVLGNMGYKNTILWTIDTADWKKAEPEVIVEKVFNNAKPGSIVLLDLNNYSNTATALPKIINGLYSKGYKFTTISKMLEISDASKLYVVKPGDTLYKIALKYKITVHELVEENNILNPKFLYPNQVLAIP